MMTIAILGVMSIAYYLGLAAQDYYLKGGEAPGKWHGGSCSALGVFGEVMAEQLQKIYEGFSPKTGEPLVQNAGKTKGYGRRRPGWDLTASAPKDVSCFVTTEIWDDVKSIHHRSVKDTVSYLEATRAFVRVGSREKGDQRLEPALIVAAIFSHLVNREWDPQLHDHVLLANAGLPSDGKFRALHSPPFFGQGQRHFLGAYYRALLAHRLWNELRLKTYRKGTGFGVRGVPKSLVELRSKRRRQVLLYMKKKGWSGGAAAAKAALATRRTKDDIPPHKELYKRWRRENKAHGMTPRAVRRMQRAKPIAPEKALPKVIAAAIKNMSRNGVSHFTAADLRLDALYEATNWGLHPEVVLNAIDEAIKNGDKLISRGRHGGKERYTTSEILERERRIRDNINVLNYAQGFIVDLKIVKMVLRKYRLTEEQRRAVEHLTRFPGLIRLLDGRAGTGKTSVVLRACKEIWEAHGYQVIGAAPTGKAAIELEEATGIPTDTIHWQLADFKRSVGFKYRHHLKQLSSAARKKRTYRLKELKPVKIDRKTILVVDEMSMVDSRHWEMLTELVQLGGGMIVGTGDTRQLPPVGGGSPFHSVCQRIGCATLKDILRQKEEWAQEASKLLSEGEAGEALAMYAERGLVTTAEDMEEAMALLVRDWSVLGVRQPERSSILTATNYEAEAVNDLCQEIRLKAGVLGGKAADIVDESEDRETTYCSRVYQGDRVLFTRNDRRLKVRNGFTGTVVGMDRFARNISVQLDGGKCVIIPVSDYRHLRRSYGLTVHKVQGSTYAECRVLATSDHQLPSAYVELSRSILATQIYTSSVLVNERLKDVEKSPLAEQMSRVPDLRLASDLRPDTLTDSGADETSEEGLPNLQKKVKAWWTSVAEDEGSVPATSWWTTQSPTTAHSTGEAESVRELCVVEGAHTAKRAALAEAKKKHSEQERRELRLIEAGRQDEIRAKKEAQEKRDAMVAVVRQQAQQTLAKLQRKPAELKDAKPVPAGWWERQSSTTATSKSEAESLRTLQSLKGHHAVKRLLLAEAKRKHSDEQRKEQQLCEAGGLEELRAKKEQLTRRDARLNAIQERRERELEQYRANVVEQLEREKAKKRHVAKFQQLAIAKRNRRIREQEGQRRYASGQMERDRIKKQQDATRMALASVIQETAEREREERRRYAMAQAESDRRRKALLTQMFLVSSSVLEPRRTQAGNRDLLDSSLTAMLSLKESTTETVTVEGTQSPIMNHFLAHLFAPPVKEVPVTLEAEVVSVEEGVAVESSVAAQGQTIDVEYSEPPISSASKPSSQPIESTNTGSYTSPQPATYESPTSSSLQPDYTSSSVCSYESSSSAFTDCQTQSIAMSTYQSTGAAQTAATQAVTQTASYYTKNS